MTMNDLIEKVSKIYGINGLEYFQKVSAGFLSENHILSYGNKKYFLKKYRFDNETRIKEVHSSKKYFFNHGISVIMPMETTFGLTFFEKDGSYFALFPFVDGIEIGTEQMTGSQAKYFGEMLGKIHFAGQKSDLDIKNQFKIEKKEKVFDTISQILERIQSKNVLDTFDRLSLEIIDIKKRFLESDDLDYSVVLENDHLIHGDYLDHNVFFDNDGQVSNVFDFEKTGYAPRTQELFRCMTYSFIKENELSYGLNLLKIFFDAYRSIYPIDAIEVKRGLDLFKLKQMNSFWVESEHYLKGNNRVDIFLEHEYVRIKYLISNSETFYHLLIHGL